MGYDYLKARQVDGQVPWDAFEEAAAIMLENGASEDEVWEFLMHCGLVIDIDANQARRRIDKLRTKIDSLELSRVLNPDSSLMEDFRLDLERQSLEAKIEMEKREHRLLS